MFCYFKRPSNGFGGLVSGFRFDQLLIFSQTDERSGAATGLIRAVEESAALLATADRGNPRRIAIDNPNLGRVHEYSDV